MKKKILNSVYFSFLPFSILLFGCVTTGLHNNSKSFTNPSLMSSKDWSNSQEMERAWQAALVRIPVGPGTILKSQMKKMQQNSVPEGGTYPTVIYLHGCSGIWPGTYRRIDFLARNGFAVIAPASFAREKYPQSCDPASHKGGMYRHTLKMRQFDAGYSIKKAKALSWVDPKNVFLMGLSQGGITTATFTSDSSTSVNARIVEGWTCHAGWIEYKGVNAPESEPILTLVGEKDPWFQTDWTKGECGEFLSKTNESRSIVYRDAALRTKHELLENDQVKETVMDFLRRHLR